jgi:lauroyl/myristoyl acyltransferase
MQIPVLPVTHAWESDRLVIEWQPLIDGADPSAGVDAIAALIERLLRRHPEQWLNWAAARIRTDWNETASAPRRARA